MNSELIQDLRYKLQKRVRRLNSIDTQQYRSTLKRFWNFLNSKEIFRGVLDELELAYSNYADTIESTSRYGDLLDVEDENEYAAIAYFMLRNCMSSEDVHLIWRTGYAVARNTSISPTFSRMSEAGEGYSAFHLLLIEPLYEYIDEQLDDQRAILALLRRYKHKCEWFQKEDLYRIWEQETQKGEKKLANHLYEYLHDQGIDFSIEPASASGEIDLISAQNTDDPLLADAKIFNSEKKKGKLYLANALNQIYIYTQNYNEPFGYLVIFKTSSEDLKFSLTNASQSTPYITYNNKTIFFIVIDIYDHKTSASKRGRLTPVDISEDYLIEVIEENPGEESPQAISAN